MSNMSYCRFQNTAGDFADCLSALSDRIEGQDGGQLSPEELAAAKRLASDAAEMLALLADFGGLDLEDELAAHGDLTRVDFDAALDAVNEVEQEEA